MSTTQLLAHAGSAASAVFLIVAGLGLAFQRLDRRAGNPFVYRSPGPGREALAIAAMLILGIVTLALTIAGGLK